MLSCTIEKIINFIQIFEKNFLKQAMQLQNQIFENVEIFCLMIHIKTTIKFAHSTLVRTHTNRKLKYSEEWKM